jgi:hypothetical protein
MENINQKWLAERLAYLQALCEVMFDNQLEEMSKGLSESEKSQKRTQMNKEVVDVYLELVKKIGT